MLAACLGNLPAYHTQEGTVFGKGYLGTGLPRYSVPKREGRFCFPAL